MSSSATGRRDDSSDSVEPATLDPPSEARPMVDWSATPLGPSATWPSSLRTLARTCLASPFPLGLTWGPEHALLYNDAYAQLLGSKHSSALGRPFQDCWGAAAAKLDDAFERACRGEACSVEHLRVFLDRHGRLEEAHFSFALSPIYDESDAIAGVWHPIIETSAEILATRRLQILAMLARQPHDASSIDDACAALTEGFAAYPFDLPFVLVYLREGVGRRARLVARVGSHERAGTSSVGLARLAPATLDASSLTPWPLAACLESGRELLVDDLVARVGRFECGPYPEPPSQAMVLPLQPEGDPRALGIVVVGLSARLPFDSGYREFVVHLAEDLGKAITRIRGQLVAAQNQAERAQIEAARAMAEQANRAKDEFLAMLGHELRNPLAPITVALQLMRLRGDPSSERERTVIERQVRHLSTLVDDLLDVSRVVRGKVSLEQRDVALASVVARGVELAGPLIEQHQHQLSLRVPRSLTVHADPTRLAQVVANLLTNAAKYTPPAGQIDVWAEAADPQVILHVRDNGIGIPRELLPSVFDLFTQGGRRSLDRSQGGLGLGLALVKNLVELHGGSVEALSDGEGRGSEFVVRLPIRGLSLERAESGPIALGRPSSGAPLRVLVVDDNRDAADMLVDVLTLLGHEAQALYDPQVTLEQAPTIAPELLFLDIGLPGIDGYELARRLRKLLGPVTLIALTGYGQDSDVQAAMNAGFDHHLVKPLDFGRLQDLLDDIGRARPSIGRSDGGTARVND